VQNARHRLRDLLEDNGHCHLPCLWGITPGQRTYQESQTILFPLRNLSKYTYLDSKTITDVNSIAYGLKVGNISPSYTEGGMRFTIDIGFLAGNDGIVTRVNFYGWILDELKKEKAFDWQYFDDPVQDYLLPHVLSVYGRPSSVNLYTLSGPSERSHGYFNILLLYPDQGILINYTTEIRVVGKNIVGCPADAHVELELFPSGKGDTFLDLLAPTKWPEMIENNYKPIEDVTSMSLEGFYQTFRQSTDKCIETPANLWPAPEE
jgi:hypothetical protein